MKTYAWNVVLSACLAASAVGCADVRPAPDEPLTAECPDADADGVCDADDTCQGGDDSTDTDGDGNPNFCDSCPEDPTDDSDGDGVCDSDDACPKDSPDDTDGDGVCDSDDVCADGDDTVDANGDGTPDHCDVCPDDTDEDGVCDSVDVCEGGNDGADGDGDGTPDFCDVCPQDNPNDADGDGVCASADICEGGDDHIDGDGDGTPDFCDICPVDALDDSDGDGVCESVDICVGFDDTVDTDGDSVPDGCDACEGSNDAVDLDLNYVASWRDSNVTMAGDGTPNACDICLLGDDRRDTDSDGTPDACDACANTNDSDVACITAATDVSAGGQFPGALEVGQLDFYSFTLDAEWSVKIFTGNGAGGCSGDTRIYLEQEGPSRRFVAADDQGGVESCSDLTLVTLEPGDYRITVDTYQRNTAIADYTLSVFINDLDGDGVADDADSCPGEDDQLDADGDGVADACDVCPGGDDNNPGPDTDGDGVPDACDMCSEGDDAVDVDLSYSLGWSGTPTTFSDGVPDACDLCVFGDDAADADADGVPDACDACPGINDSDAACVTAATDVSAGGAFLGSLEVGQLDFYTFTLATQQDVTFNTSDGTGGCTFDTRLYLEQVAPTRRFVTANDDGGTGLCSGVATVPLEPGDYRVAVDEWSRNSAIPEYTFDFVMTPAP